MALEWFYCHLLPTEYTKTLRDWVRDGPDEAPLPPATSLTRKVEEPLPHTVQAGSKASLPASHSGQLRPSPGRASQGPAGSSMVLPPQSRSLPSCPLKQNLKGISKIYRTEAGMFYFLVTSRAFFVLICLKVIGDKALVITDSSKFLSNVLESAQ